jgi:hypothetical protein
LKATIIGGTSFLLPAALVVFILSYALRLVKRVAAPISNGLHLDQLGDLAGIGAATVLSILVLVLVSFAAGPGFLSSRLLGSRPYGGGVGGWGAVQPAHGAMPWSKSLRALLLAQPREFHVHAAPPASSISWPPPKTITMLGGSAENPEACCALGVS